MFGGVRQIPDLVRCVFLCLFPEGWDSGVGDDDCPECRFTFPMSNNIRSPHLSISTTIEVTSFTDKAVILVDVHYPLTYTSLNVSKWFVPRASDTVYCAISEGSKLLVITCTSRTWNNIHTRFCGHSRTPKLKVTTAQAYKVSYGSFTRIIFTPVRQSTIMFLARL